MKQLIKVSQPIQPETRLLDGTSVTVYGPQSVQETVFLTGEHFKISFSSYEPYCGSSDPECCCNDKVEVWLNRCDLGMGCAIYDIYTGRSITSKKIIEVQSSPNSRPFKSVYVIGYQIHIGNLSLELECYRRGPIDAWSSGFVNETTDCCNTGATNKHYVTNPSHDSEYDMTTVFVKPNDRTFMVGSQCPTFGTLKLDDCVKVDGGFVDGPVAERVVSCPDHGEHTVDMSNLDSFKATYRCHGRETLFVDGEKRSYFDNGLMFLARDEHVRAIETIAVDRFDGGYGSLFPFLFDEECDDFGVVFDSMMGDSSGLPVEMVTAGSMETYIPGLCRSCLYDDRW